MIGGDADRERAYVFDMFLLSLPECTLGCTVLFLTFLEAVFVLEDSTRCQFIGSPGGRQNGSHLCGPSGLAL
jgi:hypothetical protein